MGEVVGDGGEDGTTLARISMNIERHRRIKIKLYNIEQALDACTQLKD